MTDEFRGGPRDGEVLNVRQPDVDAFYFHADEAQQPDAIASVEALIELGKGFAMHRYSFSRSRNEVGHRIFLYDGILRGNAKE